MIKGERMYAAIVHVAVFSQVAQLLLAYLKGTFYWLI